MIDRRRSRSLAGQDGFTLMELLMAMTLMLVILAATLSSFEVFSRGAESATRFADVQEQARNRVDLMVQSLRNAAAASSGSNTVLRANPSDVVINTDRPGMITLPTPTPGTARYCVDSSDADKLWFNWTPVPNTVPSAACPAAGWTQQVVVGSGLENARLSRSLFACGPVTPVNCNSTPDATRSLSIDLRLKTAESRDTSVQTGVFFRSRSEVGPTDDAPEVTTTPCAGHNLNLTVGAAGETGVDSDGNPLRVEIVDLTNNVQVGTGYGDHPLTLSTGVHNLRVRVFSALGTSTDILRTVTC